MADECVHRWRPYRKSFGTGQVPDDPPPDADDLRDPDEEPEPIGEE